MMWELKCAGCRQQFQMETEAGVVACPHCGVELEVSVVTDSQGDESLSSVTMTGPASDELDAAIISGIPIDGASTDVTTERDNDEGSSIPAIAGRGMSAQPGENDHWPTVREMGAGPPPAVSRTLFLAVLGYATAVTVALIYLIVAARRPNPHDLESLPDVKPPMKDGRVALTLVPVAAAMPPGHTLKLGVGRRFGNVRVTPLRVSRGPLQFVHFTGDKDKYRPFTDPVLKLWLRFENVSQDQAIAPLDRELLFARVADRTKRGRSLANQFLCQADQKTSAGTQLLVFGETSRTSEWDFQSQQLGRVLKPGEAMETYIPTDSVGVGHMQGDLIWRVHFRKGFHRETHRGVTTLVEVPFSSEGIIEEPAPMPRPAPPVDRKPPPQQQPGGPPGEFDVNS